MKSIGVYGDSFADPGPDWIYIDPNTSKEERTHNFNSWSMKFTSDYNVTNYGSGGTSISYSYLHFLKTQHYHDIIIFVRSNPHRYTYFKKTNMHIHAFAELPFEEKIKNLNYNFSVLFGNLSTSLMTSENKRKQELPRYDRKLLETIFDFQTHYPENDYIAFEAITDSIKLRRPDTYFIDAFSVHGEPCLFNITKADYDSVGSKEECTKTRFCHMSIKQNDELYHIVKNIIEGRSSHPISHYLHLDNFRNYFTISKTKKEAGLL
jgi:hypothetical protein